LSLFDVRKQRLQRICGLDITALLFPMRDQDFFFDRNVTLASCTGWSITTCVGKKPAGVSIKYHALPSAAFGDSWYVSQSRLANNFISREVAMAALFAPSLLDWEEINPSFLSVSLTNISLQRLKTLKLLPLPPTTADPQSQDRRCCDRQPPSRPAAENIFFHSTWPKYLIYASLGC
jgi:hypothetical protein